MSREITTVTAAIELKPLVGEEQFAPTVLLHELTEALTAAGNYLAAATTMLDATVDPPETTLREVLEKSLAQLSRSAEALQRLRNAISPGSARNP